MCLNLIYNQIMAKKKVNKIIKGLKKASKTHAKQAKTLESLKLKNGGKVKSKGKKYVLKVKLGPKELLMFFIQAPTLI